jgi:deazaflavin-dependent oxidoreductase (nitroreductase family)
METSATMDNRIRKTRVPSFVPIFNPVARRLLGAGVPLGPNAVLTVRGRKSGALRSTPVALVEVGGRRWIVGTFGEVNWVQNLRAARDATISVKRRALPVQAIELSPAEVSSFFREVLTPYINRVPFGRWMIGTLLGARDILNDPEGAASSHPVFELKPRS